MTLTNLSPVTATFSPPNITGSDAANYVVINNTCQTSLPPAPATCHYTVEATASALGPFSADLLINLTNDPGQSPIDIPLSGTGTFP